MMMIFVITVKVVSLAVRNHQHGRPFLEIGIKSIPGGWIKSILGGRIKSILGGWIKSSHSFHSHRAISLRLETQSCQKQPTSDHNFS